MTTHLDVRVLVLIHAKVMESPSSIREGWLPSETRPDQGWLAGLERQPAITHTSRSTDASQRMARVEPHGMGPA